MEKKKEQETQQEATLPLKELCTVCNVEETYIIEMVEMGILEPYGKVAASWEFSIVQIHRLRKAQRLQSDLSLNLAGVALSLELLDEMEELRNSIKKLEYQLKLLTQL